MKRAMRFVVLGVLLAAILCLGIVAGRWLYQLPLADAHRAMRDGNHLIAAGLAEARLAEEPADQRAMLIAARAYARLERWPQAEAYFSQVPLKEAADFHLRARGLVARELVLEAASVYEQILHRWPLDGEALRSLAAIRAMKQDRLDEAIILVRRLSRIPSHQVVGHAMLGELEFSQANVDRCIEAIETALSLSPDLSELPPGKPATILQLYAHALLLQGRAEQAEPYALRSRDLSSDAETSWVLGQIRQQLGDEEGAKRYWEEAVARDPRFLPALRDIGQLCLKRNDPSQALEWFLRARDIDPDDSATKYCLVTTYRYLGKTEEADRLNEPARDSLGTPDP